MTMTLLDRGTIMQLDPALFEPHGDRYLVEYLNKDRWHTVPGTDYKIELPVYNRDKGEQEDGYYYAKIIAKGNGHRLEVDVTVPMPFEVDDVVCVVYFSGQEMKLVGREFRMVNQVDILCKVPQLCPPTRLDRDVLSATEFKHKYEQEHPGASFAEVYAAVAEYVESLCPKRPAS